jgi:DNA (cytosine-5)-methyltransferase 1
MRELALFAGAGGGILGGHLLGWRTVCAVEWDAYAASVLVARQNDGCLAPFPIWDDVQTFDGRPWRGRVDVVSGGFPCTDISVAGKGAGIDGQASGMWRHMARIIGEVRPRYVFVENSPMLVHRGLARVLGDLASLGFDARWGVLGAHDVGAPHKRDRIWIVANANGRRRDGTVEKVCAGRDELVAGGASVVDADDAGREKQRRTLAAGAQHGAAERPSWWSAEPDVGRVAHGVAARVDRLRCIGNGQVPRVAAAAWRLLGGCE